MACAVHAQARMTRFAWWLASFSLLALACGGNADTVFEGGGASGGAGGAGGAGGGQGQCSCEAAPWLVCGVDGETYDAACGESCVPVDIACQHACPCSACDDLQAQYADALARAKACNPALDVETCTAVVDDQLACPCETSINPGNAEAAAELADLAAQWQALGCFQDIACPAIACPGVVGGRCGTSGPGNDGSCEDQYAD